MAHTLLLADDSVTIQRVIELTFADEDVHVVAVSDGDQAIAKVEESPPDIVLADVGMPGRNGYEVARYIKASPKLAHIPVVLLTGAFEPVDQERAAQAGCDGVLAKPFEPQAVIARVKELLATRRPPASAVQPSAQPVPPAPPNPPAFDDMLAPPPARPTPAEVGDYFDRLDVAFANLPSAQAAAKPAYDLDHPGIGDSSDLPLTQTSTMTTTPSPSPEPQTIAIPAPPAPPPLSEVFTALLAAELEQVGAAPPWPSNGAPALGDDAVETITRKVIERLSDQAVKQAVAEIVTDVAERLVREEIARIKASIG